MIPTKASVFWLDDPARPPARGAARGDEHFDLVVVGAGFTGLWTALLAKQRDPNASVAVVEGGRIACGATGRNGGFVSASLTHGIGNGLDRWPDEMPTLVRLGHENLDAIENTVAEFGIECDFVRAGALDVAVAEHQVAEMRAFAAAAAALDEDAAFLDEVSAQALVHSPKIKAGVRSQREVALVNPARLAWGLAKAAEQLGVRVFEHTPVRRLRKQRLDTDTARITAGRIALATNAYPPLLKRVAAYVVPVYDSVLVTEPLTAQQWQAIGWDERFGMADAGNQFHYFRPTADGRILWGGYDAVYHYGNGFGPQFENDEACYQRLAEHFVEFFPQLAGITFTHGWGGAIDTCSRFSAFWGTAHDDTTAYVAGFTGLGVGASRFGANVMLDLLAGERTERTELEMVKTKPIPFPPEPLRSIGIALTTKSLQAADRNGGKRNLWLQTLDRVGLGFDS